MCATPLADVQLAIQKGETLHSQIAREIVEAGAGRMPELSALHPITLEPPHLTAEQKSFASEKHSDAVNKLLTAEKAKADGYTFDEVLRVVLAVQFNAFSSGMYFALAMINHACSPNCSKFAPRKQAKAGAWKTGGDGAAAGGGGGEGPAVNALPKVPSAGSAAASSSSTSSSANARLGSEIVACRDIKAGTEITIHYSTTVERAHHTRDRTFREQHYMPLDPSPFPDEIDGTLTKEQMKLATELDTALDEFDTGTHAHTHVHFVVCILGVFFRLLCLCFFVCFFSFPDCFCYVSFFALRSSFFRSSFFVPLFLYCFCLCERGWVLSIHQMHVCHPTHHVCLRKV